MYVVLYYQVFCCETILDKLMQPETSGIINIVNATKTNNLHLLQTHQTTDKEIYKQKLFFINHSQCKITVMRTWQN